MFFAKVFFSFVALCTVVVFRLIKVYPHPFDPYTQFEKDEVLRTSVEVDPWTSWTTQDLYIARMGKKYAKETSLVIGCLVRDIGENIQYVENKFRTLGSIFQRIHVIFMENNSIDNTREILLRWTKKSPWKNITFVCINPDSYEINSDKCHLQLTNSRCGVLRERIERMAFLRNRLHNYICKWLNVNSSFEYVLYLDVDLRGIIYKRGIEHTFGVFLMYKDVQVMGFRGTTEKGWLWDPYAYEPIDNNGNLSQLLFARLSSRKVNISMREIVPVKSSFSGGTFIRSRDMNPDYKYEVITPIGNISLCEHVSFYRNFEHFFINTRMIQTHRLH